MWSLHVTTQMNSGRAWLAAFFKDASGDLPRHVEVNVVDTDYIASPNFAFAAFSGYLSKPFAGVMLGFVGITHTTRFVNPAPTSAMIKSLAQKIGSYPAVASFKSSAVVAALVSRTFGTMGANIVGVYDPAYDVVLDFRPNAYIYGHQPVKLVSSLDYHGDVDKDESVHVHINTRSEERTFNLSLERQEYMRLRGAPTAAVFLIHGDRDPDEWSYMDFRRDICKHMGAIRISTGAKVMSVSIDASPLIGYMVGEELPEDVEVVFFDSMRAIE